MKFKPIKGVICPTVTPLKANGDINPDMIPPLVEFLIAKGLKGIYPLGTTGEGPLFSMEERKTIAEASVEAVAGRLPVIIHTGAINTRDTLDLTQHACDIGATAAAVITPFYYPLSEKALERHYRAILESTSDFPIYFYNLPSMAGNRLSADLATRLARDYANAVGLKDSSGDLQTMFVTNHLRGGDFNTAIGPDILILAGLSMGLDASVSGHSNLLPELVVGIYDAVRAGDLDAAQKRQRQLNAVGDVIAGGGWLPVIKGMMAHRGLPVGGVRRPLLNASEETIRACLAQLQALRVDLSRV